MRDQQPAGGRERRALRLSPGQRGRGLPGCFDLAASRVCLPTLEPLPGPSCLPLLRVSGARPAPPPLSCRFSHVSDEVTENSLSCRTGAAADSEMLQLLKLGARCAPGLQPSKPGTRRLQSSRGPHDSRCFRAWLCLTLPTLGAPLPALGFRVDCPWLASSGTAGRVCPARSEGRRKG